MAESNYTAPNDFRAFCEMLGETEASICHHGIKGQRWGVRRFQKENGSLTPEGEERYSKKKISTSTKLAIGASIGTAMTSRILFKHGNETAAKRSIIAGGAIVGTILAGGHSIKTYPARQEKEKRRTIESESKLINNNYKQALKKYKNQELTYESETELLNQLPKRANLDSKELARLHAINGKMMVYDAREKTGYPRENTKKDYAEWDKLSKEYDAVAKPIEEKIQKELGIGSQMSDTIMNDIIGRGIGKSK